MRTWIICGAIGALLLTAASRVETRPRTTALPVSPRRVEASARAPQPPAAPSALVVEGLQIWTDKCGNCHTLGEGNKVGPDLRGVHARREAVWLERWLRDPVGMGKADPIGKELVAQFYNTPMPPQHLSDAQIAAVLAYIREDATRAGTR